MSARVDLYDRMAKWWPLVLRYGGFGGAMYEVFVDDLERPSILILLAGMMGLREVIEAQKARNEKRDSEQQEAAK